MATGLSDRLLDLLQLWFLTPAVFVEVGEEGVEEGGTVQDESLWETVRVTWSQREALMCYYMRLY